MYQKRNNELEIFSLYTNNFKERFYLREISRTLNIPLKTIQNTLKNIENKKLLKSNIEGKNKYFSLNLDNILTKSYLLQAEIYKTEVFLEKYPQIKTFLKSLKDDTPLIVFGSFAKLKASKDSDLDLIILSKNKTKLQFHLIPFKVHKIYLTKGLFAKALNNKENLIKEIEENHIILNNHSFYINVLWGHHGK